MHSSSSSSNSRSRRTGLLPAEILVNRRKFGVNKLEIKKRESLWKKFLRQFVDLLVIVLIIASLLSFAFGEMVDGAVILAIVFINALIGFFQEYKTERMLEALQELVAPTARVLRSSKGMVLYASVVGVRVILMVVGGM